MKFGLIDHTPDDVAVGDWIVLLDDRWRQTIEYRDFLAVDAQRKEMNGTPFEVIGIALPYLAVRRLNERETGTLDVRRWVFRRAERSYVQALMQQERIDTVLGSLEKGERKTNTRICPLCGAPMAETKLMCDGDWKLSCTECKFEGVLR